MRILGIDPGYAIVGCGIIEYDGRTFRTIEYGAITTPAGMEFSERLSEIYDQLMELIHVYKPEAMAVEKLFFNSNQKTAIDAAQARGVIVLAGQAGQDSLLRVHPSSGEAGSGRLRPGRQKAGN